MQKLTVTTLMVVLPTFIAAGDVVEYQTADRDKWFTDVGGMTNASTVDFAGFADFTPITDQWSYLGVNFSGFVVTSGFDDIAYPNDGWGARGEPDITVTFDEPINWIAADFPGSTTIELYRNDQLLYTSGLLGGGGPGHFGGLYSAELFDRARFVDPFGAHADFLDDLYFGPIIAVPAPGVLAPLALLLLPCRRRECP